MPPSRLGPLIAAVSAACMPALSVPEGARIACRTGVDCPAPLVCLDASGRCVDASTPCVSVDAERRSAEAVADGALCTTSDGERGACRAGRCGGTCGDGIVDGAAGELCDDAAGNSDTVPDACRSTCLPAHCGDGVLDRGESCDDDDDACDACLRVCSIDTMDLDGAAGCEAPLSPTHATRGFAVGATFVDGAAGRALVYVSIAGPDDELRRLELTTGDDRLLVAPPDFVVELDAGAAGVAYLSGTFAELWFLPDGASSPEAVTDQVQAFALTEQAIFVVRTDGTRDLLARIDLATRDETLLSTDVSFPTVLAVTPTRVVWSRGTGDLASRPLSGGSVAVVTDAIVEPGLLIADGETLWAVDYVGDLWRVDDTDARLVARRPPLLAGTLAIALSARGDRWAMSSWLGGDALDQSDDEGMLMVGALDGTTTMRARARGFFSAVVVDEAAATFAGDGVFAVPP